MAEYKITKFTMTCVKRNHDPKSKYKIQCRATQTPDKCQGRIRCLGGVSILCWTVTPADRGMLVSPGHLIPPLVYPGVSGISRVLYLSGHLIPSLVYPGVRVCLVTWSHLWYIQWSMFA
jgi:hypothetical protein